MKISIQQKVNQTGLEVVYPASNGKIIKSGLIGTISIIDNFYVLMIDNKPCNVATSLAGIGIAINKKYKVKPNYINVLL